MIGLDDILLVVAYRGVIMDSPHVREDFYSKLLS